MATGITIEIKADTTGFKRDVKSALDSGSAQVRELKSAIDSATSSFGSMRSALGGLKTAFLAIGGALGGAYIFKQIAEAAVQSAVSIDKTRQAITALTGSVDAANKKIAELRRLAASSPGVTTSFATQLYQQLAAIGTITDSTINKVIQSVGKLNAVFGLENPTGFARNIQQIFDQGFERGDIKEALGQVPIFEQLLEQAFGTKDPAKLKKLKDAGKLTAETYYAGIIDAINQRFPQVADSIGAQFEKLKDRVVVALEPLGAELTKILLPVFDDAVKKIEEYGDSAARVFKENRNDIIATAKEITAMTVEIGKLIGKLVEVGAKSGVFEFLATGAAVVQDIISDPYYLQNSITRGVVAGAGGGDAESAFRGPRERAVRERFEQLNREAAASRAVERMGLTTANKPTGPYFDPISGRTVNPSEAVAGGNNNRRDNRDTAARAARRGRNDLYARYAPSADDLVTSQYEGIADPAALIKQSSTITNNIRQGVIQAIQQQDKAREEQDRARQAVISELQRTSRRDLNRSGQFIGDAVNRGQLTSDQADALGQQANRQYASQLREILALEQQRGEISQSRIDDLADEINLYDRLGTTISASERFMRGFNSSIISVGDAFDRFGQNVAGALTNTKNLLDGLKQSLLQLFNDLLGRSLQNIVGQALAPLAALFGGGGGSGGVLNNLFRTPSFAGGQGLAGVGFGTGFGIDVPASVTAGSLPIFRGNITNPNAIAGLGGGVLSTAAAKPSFLSGIGKSIASAAPLIGLSAGQSLGGQSITGQILGSGGGLLAGGAVAGFAGGLGPAATAFFTNPFTIGIGAALLVGSVLLGKSAQRKKDEEAAGQYLTQALQALDQLIAGVQSGQIDGNQARSIFENQILGTFIQQINGLKTESVRKSRLTNQVADLRKVYEARVVPAIAEQQQKATDALAQQRRQDANALTYSKLIPEFATGGYVGGIDRGFDSVKALLRPGELVLNRSQQASVMARAGADVFRAAGVPAINTTGRYADGGYAPSNGGAAGQQVVIEQLTIEAVVDSEGIAIKGMSTKSGQRVIINQINQARLNREF
jgi:hypothetical protein